MKYIVQEGVQSVLKHYWQQIEPITKNATSFLKNNFLYVGLPVAALLILYTYYNCKKPKYRY